MVTGEHHVSKKKKKKQRIYSSISKKYYFLILRISVYKENILTIEKSCHLHLHYLFYCQGPRVLQSEKIYADAKTNIIIRTFSSSTLNI